MLLDNVQSPYLSMTTLDNRPRVCLPRPCYVVQHAKRDDSSEPQHSPVEVLGCHIPAGRPEAEDEDVEQISARERVVGDPEGPVHPPRPPRQAAPYRVGESVVVVADAYGPSHSAPEEEGRGNEV